ncbi:hypothetical protein CVT26_010044 [Gymnopilus dilepis]|uniref:Uncharacterized protein n=1 Tax=Gymnopilus dilepis TaxID=231916 RepID=A0A409WTK2_9AGAR|nr:hypothetical protein CVT26_010044 [Gymnopilus dilepis]
MSRVWALSNAKAWFGALDLFTTPLALSRRNRGQKQPKIGRVIAYLYPQDLPRNTDGDRVFGTSTRRACLSKSAPYPLMQCVEAGSQTFKSQIPENPQSAGDRDPTASPVPIFYIATHPNQPEGLTRHVPLFSVSRTSLRSLQAQKLWV